MSYTALYRKWRPAIFDDVKGQDHIVRTLTNQIETDRVGHAYLFCGTRGTGKTTAAKIFARAVNCEHPVGGNPCGECAVCRAIANGSSLNVIEIDAASNNGVDSIRQIRDEVEYRPTEGRYKVYIVDEVHMLTVQAFNALLKTLEEPPEYVIFILATTEVHKIPVTILSRCQRYDFKRISVDTIAARLKELTLAEDVKIEDKAINYIARMADGALRDALSLLDQCIAMRVGELLRYEDVLEALGTVDTEVFSNMLRLVIDSDVPGIIGYLDKLIMNGRDLGQFVADFTWYLRNLLLLITSPEAEDIIDMSTENLARLKEETVAVDAETVLRYIRILSELTQAIKFSTQKRVLVEVALIKLTRPQMEKDVGSLTERLNRLEKLIGEKEDLIALTAIRPEIPMVLEGEIPKPAIPKVKPTIKALPEDVETVAKNWRGIIGQADAMVASYLEKCRISVDNDKLVIVAEDSFAHKYLTTDESIEHIKDIIERTIHKTVDFNIKLLEKDTTFEENYASLEDYVKMDISIED